MKAADDKSCDDNNEWSSKASLYCIVVSQYASLARCRWKRSERSRLEGQERLPRGKGGKKELGLGGVYLCRVRTKAPLRARYDNVSAQKGSPGCQRASFD
jgi:hypothetical protein